MGRHPGGAAGAAGHRKERNGLARVSLRETGTHGAQPRAGPADAAEPRRRARRGPLHTDGPFQFCAGGNIEDPIHLFRKLRERRKVPADTYFYSVLLRGIFNKGNPEQVRQGLRIFEGALADSIPVNQTLLNIAVKGWARSNRHRSLLAAKKVVAGCSSAACGRTRSRTTS